MQVCHFYHIESRGSVFCGHTVYTYMERIQLEMAVIKEQEARVKADHQAVTRVTHSSCNCLMISFNLASFTLISAS